MSSDTELEARDIRAGYIAWCRGELTRDMAGEKFDHFIAKVKADALREAAEDMDNTDDPDAIHIANGDADLWLKARADQIEREINEQ